MGAQATKGHSHALTISWPTQYIAQLSVPNVHAWTFECADSTHVQENGG